MFQKLLAAIETNIANTILKVSLQPASTQPVYTDQRQSANISANQRANQKIGRNDPCPCGAKHPDGRPIKYKNCHGR